MRNVRSLILVFFCVIDVCYGQTTQIRIDTLYFESNSKFAIDHYSGDSLIHRSIFLKETNKKIIESGFREYHFDGMYIEWHENGEMAANGFMDKGFKIGTWIYWDSLGRRISIKDYSKDSLMSATFYEYYDNGNIKSIKTYKDKTFKQIKLDKDLYEIREREQIEMIPDGKWIYYAIGGKVISIDVKRPFPNSR